MKEKLTHNLELKILAIVFAVILWLIVVNIDDPAKSIQFSGVEVQILNAAELEKQGLCYDILDESNYVTVTITGRRSVIEEISKENISATADMKDLTSMNTLTIKATCNKSANELDSIRLSDENVKLEVEKLSKVSKRIYIQTNGTPSEGYIVGNRSLDLNQVEISGPESIVSTIETARAEVDVTNATADVSASIPIVLYDKKGEVVESPRLNMNIAKVSINQEILYTKIVPVVYRFTGTPEEGYALSDKTQAKVEQVYICGKKSRLDAVEAIYVQGQDLSVEGARNNTSFTIDLEDYLPTNIEFASKDFSGVTTVTAVIQKEVYMNLKKDVKSISAKGLPTGKKMEIVDDNTLVRNGELEIRIFGLSDRLEEIDEKSLSFVIDIADYMNDNDMTELPAGNYYIEPTVELPTGVHLEEGKLHIRISDL